MAVQLEKIIQSQGVSLLKSLGGEVFESGTRRGHVRCKKCGSLTPEHYGTRQTPGIADVHAFLPPPRYPRPNLEGPQAIQWRELYWEAKAPGGRPTPEQRRFKELCEWSGVAHVLGDLDALIAWLIAREYLKAENVPHYRQPKAVGA